MTNKEMRQHILASAKSARKSVKETACITTTLVKSNNLYLITYKKLFQLWDIPAQSKRTIR